AGSHLHRRALFRGFRCADRNQALCRRLSVFRSDHHCHLHDRPAPDLHRRSRTPAAALGGFQPMTDRQQRFLRQRVGLLAGPLAFVLMLVLPGPENLAPEAWRVAAVAVLMITWWISEALP